MEFRHLRSFLAVAQEQSFTRAAERLHMAQPPLSTRIRQLEEHLGVQLFDRHTRKVVLSAAGKAFLEAVRPAVAQLDQAAEACRRASRGETGTLLIGYSGRASHRLLPRLLMAFRTRFPEVELDLVGPQPSGALKTALAEGQLDVALCFLPIAGVGLVTRSLATIDFVLAVPDSHPLAKKRRVDLAKLADEAFVGYPANRGFLLRSAMDETCRRAGFFPRVVRESDTSTVLLCLVAAGTGVSIVPRELQTQEPVAGVVFKSLGPHACTLDHGLAWRKDNTNPALQNLLSVAEATEGGTSFG